MVDLDELKRLAEDGQWMPADTAKKLIAVALKAAAVVQRWDTPLWKDVPATADYINELRAALEELK